MTTIDASPWEHFEGHLFKRKPTVIRAVQLTWKTWSEVCGFVGDLISEDNPGFFITADEASDTCGENDGEGGAQYIGLKLPTMHGDLAVFRHGDWIIPDGKPRTFYPCKPEVFDATYEAIEE